MNTYEHLPLTPYQGEVQRQTRGGGGRFKNVDERVKSDYSRKALSSVSSITSEYEKLKKKFSGIMKPSLIFELEINQSVDVKSMEATLTSMGIHVLASAGHGTAVAGCAAYGDVENCVNTKTFQPSNWVFSAKVMYMVKPELVEFGGNLILSDNFGYISENVGGKVLVLNNSVTRDLVKFHSGTSFSAPKIAHVAGQIANKYPQKSGAFIKNLLLLGSAYPYAPTDEFYQCKSDHALSEHIRISGYGLPSLEKALYSFDNRVVLFDEGSLQLNKVKVYTLRLPDVFFAEKGRKRVIVSLAFAPQTRSSRGDSYLGNRMEFHLYHTVNPQTLVEHYGSVDVESEQEVPEALKKFEITLFPGSNTRKAGCHQKAWREYKRDPRNRPASPVSLVLINYNKWLPDENAAINYCLSVTFEHEKEIDLYNQIRAVVQTRVKV